MFKVQVRSAGVWVTLAVRNCMDCCRTMVRDWEADGYEMRIVGEAVCADGCRNQMVFT